MLRNDHMSVEEVATVLEGVRALIPVEEKTKIVIRHERRMRKVDRFVVKRYPQGTSHRDEGSLVRP